MIEIKILIIDVVLDLILVHFFHFQILISGKYAISFGVNNSLSVHLDSKKKNTLDLCEGPTQGIVDTTVTAEARYSINFTR